MGKAPGPEEPLLDRLPSAFQVEVPLSNGNNTSDGQPQPQSPPRVLVTIRMREFSERLCLPAEETAAQHAARNS